MSEFLGKRVAGKPGTCHFCSHSATCWQYLAWLVGAVFEPGEELPDLWYPFVHSLIHRYLFSAYCVTGIVLGAEYTVVNKTD